MAKKRRTKKKILLVVSVIQHIQNSKTYQLFLKLLGIIYAITFLLTLLVVLFSLAIYLVSLVDWSKLNENFFRLALEYLKVLIWPIVILIVITIFSGEVKKIFNRINTLEWRGASAQFRPSTGQSPPMTDTENLNDELNDNTQQKGETDEEYEDRIYRKPEIQLAFERTYRFIFGTQIDLLYKIAAMPNQTIVASQLRPFYEEHLRLLKAENSFQDYVGFLKTQSLLSYDKATDSYQLLPAGRLFLRYLVEQGLNDPMHKTL